MDPEFFMIEPGEDLWIESVVFYQFAKKGMVFCIENCFKVLWENIIPSDHENVLQIQGWRARILK